MLSLYWYKISKNVQKCLLKFHGNEIDSDRRVFNKPRV